MPSLGWRKLSRKIPVQRKWTWVLGHTEMMQESPMSFLLWRRWAAVLSDSCYVNDAELSACGSLLRVLVILSKGLVNKSCFTWTIDQNNDLVSGLPHLSVFSPQLFHRISVETLQISVETLGLFLPSFLCDNSQRCYHPEFIFHQLFHVTFFFKSVLHNAAWRVLDEKFGGKNPIRGNTDW